MASTASKTYKCAKAGCGYIANSIKDMLLHKQECGTTAHMSNKEPNPGTMEEDVSNCVTKINFGNKQKNSCITPVALTAPILNPAGLTPFIMGEDVRQCVLCFKVVGDKLRMKNHILEHYKSYLMPLPPKKGSFSLYNRMPYKCSYCSADLHFEQNLLWHYAFTHNLIKMYTNEEELEGKIVTKDTLTHIEDATNFTEGSRSGPTDAFAQPDPLDVSLNPCKIADSMDSVKAEFSSETVLMTEMPSNTLFNGNGQAIVQQQMPGSKGSVQQYPNDINMPEDAMIDVSI